MSEHQTSSSSSSQGEKQSHRGQQQRKQRVLTHKHPARVESIADALVIKNDAIFFLCERNGQVPLGQRHGLGIYYHDCRYLNGYEFRLGGKLPHVLASTPRRGYMGLLELTNLGFHTEDGTHVEKETIGVTWERLLDVQPLGMHERFTFHNYGREAMEFSVSLTFQADFEDVFIIRGLLKAKQGEKSPCQWDDRSLRVLYQGKDDLYRGVQIHFSQKPEATEGTTAHFRLKLTPQQECQLGLSILLAEAPERKQIHQRNAASKSELEQFQDRLASSPEATPGMQTDFHSDSLLLQEMMHRALSDIRVLGTHLEDLEFLAAGIPWFATIFGRDSVITALQVLAYDPRIAEQTLRLLARFQGTEVNEWRDEQPGKILHELRVGELAHRGLIPHTPFYGTVDATPLFLILLGQHAAWTGSLQLFEELRNNVERALQWMEHCAETVGNGYLAYDSPAGEGLINQGWKDSGDAIVNADGSLARPPIALVEVQGYAYRALLTVADLCERSGDADPAKQLRTRAASLRERFNQDFWLPEKNCYALALQAGGAPATVISSNPGQALWGGIADPEKARKTAKRLLTEDLYSGWGIRTLSTREQRYNPIGYHLGTVWPHDNSLIAAGFRQYGDDEAAHQVCTGILEAASHFPAYRLPEVFAGFDRKAYGVPVHYPVACHPQAWAAGAIPYLLETLLGLVPEAFENRLRIVRPLLPDIVDRLELHGMRVGDAQVDLKFSRQNDNQVQMEVLRVKGKLDVQRE